MDSDSPIVVYDANVLFPFHVGHILTFMAFKRLVLAKWTEKIQTEWLESIAEKYPDDFEGCKRRCAAMNRAMPDAMVVGYEHRIGSIVFHDPEDKHVIAAAIHANAIGIVTLDRDFSNLTLKPFGLVQIDPDALLEAARTAIPRIAWRQWRLQG
jgi:predicted nucleic acid-binding protein